MRTRSARRPSAPRRRNPFVGKPGTEGVHAIVFHGSRSPPEEFTKFLKSGFAFAGAGGMYGYGLYTVFHENDTLRTTTGVYGNYVYRLAVKVRDFLVFDYDAAVEIYGEDPPTIKQQEKMLGVWRGLGPHSYPSYPISLDDWDEVKDLPGGYTGELAQVWFQRALVDLNFGHDVKFPNGLVFRGRQDGPVCVIFNPESVKLIGYRTVDQKTYTPMNVEGRDWQKKVSAPSPGRLVVGDADISPKQAFSALTQYFLKQYKKVTPRQAAGWVKRGTRPLGMYRDVTNDGALPDENVRDIHFVYATVPVDVGETVTYYLLTRGRPSGAGGTQSGEITVDGRTDLQELPDLELVSRSGNREIFATDRPVLGYRVRAGWDDETNRTRYETVPVLVPVVAPPPERVVWPKTAAVNQNPASSKFMLRDLTPEETQLLVDAFRQSYIEATGAAWSTETFLSRARSWTFYGEVTPARTGVVAIRHQRSGMNKLVAVAGAPRAVLAGIKALMEDRKDEPVWGAVSADLVPMCKRFGLIPVHEKTGGVLVMKAVAEMIPTEVFGGSTVTVQPDGALRVNVIEIGPVNKYFVANKAYFMQLADNPGIPIPAATRWMLRRFVGSLM